jgi:hypothetical protein
MSKQNSVVVGGANVHHNSQERIVLALNIPRTFPDGRASAEAQMERSLEDLKGALTQWGDLHLEDVVTITKTAKFRITDIGTSKPSNGERCASNPDTVVIYVKLPGYVNRGNCHGSTASQRLTQEYDILAAHAVKAAEQYWKTVTRNVKGRQRVKANA